ncbi:MAG: UDP-2,3-diacylglucosamine diphosphatase [Candidatus Kapabacteria bacterium]|nr:UDP-2,3-diacylglucosamine diphosphatase [Candidatus Kapabacteria bacterium]
MVYFISDVHLGFGTHEESLRREQDLLAVLDRIKTECTTLYLVGDIFDYWFEYGTVLPRQFFRTLTKLDELKRNGTGIEYLMGNHDFGHQDFFERDLLIPVHKGDVECTISGKRFYLAHGDGKVYNDTGYLILRSILRNRICIKLYQWLHPDIGIRLASGTSHKSRAYTDTKEYGKPDGLADFAEKKITHDMFDYVIMGHQHKPTVREYGSGTHTGIYMNLGDWIQHRTFARFDGTTLELLNVDEFLASNTYLTGCG